MTSMKKRISTALTASILATTLTIPATAVETSAIRVCSYKGTSQCSLAQPMPPSALSTTGSTPPVTSDPRCDCIGVGVTQHDGITYCYMFVGIPNSVNFYA